MNDIAIPIAPNFLFLTIEYLCFFSSYPYEPVLSLKANPNALPIESNIRIIGIINVTEGRFFCYSIHTYEITLVIKTNSICYLLDRHICGAENLEEGRFSCYNERTVPL